MILAEPPPSQGDLHFSLLGYPVRIHPWFWLIAAMMGLNLHDPVRVTIWVLSMLLCILLHEMGHAVVMQAYGFAPSIVLYSFGGLAIPHPGRFGVRRPGPWGQMLISFAGPASGFILAALLLLGLHFLAGYPVVQYVTSAGLRAGDNLVVIFNPTWRDVVPVLFQVVPHQGSLEIASRPDLLGTLVNCIFEITVLWGLLNLLPIYPLDGGQIAQQIFVLNNPQDAIRQSLILSVVVGGLMAVMAFMKWDQPYLAVLFVWMTYSNYMTLQSHQIRGGW